MGSDVTPPGSSQSRDRGKGRAEDVGEVLSTRSKSKQKRVFHDSPTKVHPDAKRVRQDDAASEVDLVDLTVDEDSLVDPNLVPGIVGKVSSWVVVFESFANWRA